MWSILALGAIERLIHLKHILHFADIKVDFSYHDKPVTLILGDQASGKTSILRFSCCIRS
jgi:ABC-type cobalamin/Fe3+-siderophores transport system ATPase subunit